MKKYNIYLIILVLGIFTLDMYTKITILNIFDNNPYPMSSSISVIGNFFKLTYVRNYGITFGLLNNIPRDITVIVLSGTSLLALCVLWYFYKNIGKLLLKKALPTGKIALSMILGGAAGNIFDRLIHGYVIDFLDFGVKSYRWYTFNIADIFIVSGCILLSILMFFFEIKKKD